MTMNKFKYVISLGYFCSPALELRRLGLRDASYPLDWTISYDFSLVMRLIENHFVGFLSEDSLYQLKEMPNCYRDKKNKVDFYHDFDELRSLKRQLFDVKQKYNRRIARFYDTIKHPTLFVRYVSTLEEYLYICENYEMIQLFFKKFNSNNEVHFVVSVDSDGIQSSDMNIWYVEADENESVARKFLDKNEELRKYILENVEYRADGDLMLSQRKLSLGKRIGRKLCLKLKLYYRHNRTVAHADR